MMNYHELTMAESRYSPQRRKQFLVICLIMFVTFMYSFVTAGGFSSVEIEEGEFTGGTYVFKQSKRDYAAAMGLNRFITKEIGLKPKASADVVYTLYLDDPRIVTDGRSQRFAAGILARHENDEKAKELLDKNPSIQPYTEEDLMELPAGKLWEKIKYESEKLPKTKAAVVQFPFTNGFISALLLTWRVIPALHNHLNSVAGGTSAVVISTCSIEDQMCTHYAPLKNEKNYLLGQEPSKEYAKNLGPTKFFDFDQAAVFLNKMFPFGKFFGGSKSKVDQEL